MLKMPAQMTTKSIASEADAFLRSEAEAGRFRGAALFALNSQGFLRSGYGLANEEWALANTPTTKFRIGSVTKTFTAASVLRLLDTGKVDRSASVGTWLEDLPQAWQSFTIHQRTSEARKEPFGFRNDAQSAFPSKSGPLENRRDFGSGTPASSSTCKPVWPQEAKNCQISTQAKKNKRKFLG